jgi:hypothetical protein
MADKKRPVPEVEDEGDELPAELDVTGYVGQYMFPDNSRRRIPGVLYLVVAVLCFALWASRHTGGVFVNDGFLYVSIGLALVAVYHLFSGVHRKVDDTDALVAATREVGFPVGHASAQLSWRGLLSRPTWRILLYSAENPPAKRGLVLVDGIDASIVAHFVEDNPEDWSQLDR